MDSPLNIAHRHRRKAEALVRAGKYDEALEHHAAAERALAKVELLGNCENILQSVRLQRQDHIRQQAVIKYKQRKAESKGKMQQEVPQSAKHEKKNSPSSVDSEFYRTNKLIHRALQAMCEQNSLIIRIADAVRRGGSLSAFSDAPMSRSLDSRVQISKSEEAKLEELCISNEELKKVLFMLIADMERLRSENKTLRNSLEEVLFNHEKCLSSKASNSLPESRKNSLTPHASVIGNKNTNYELPELAPVKIPNFDLKEK